MSKSIWERHYYRNRDIGFLVNDEIIEYDIKSAGLNLAKEFKYLDENIIHKLESMDKERRNIQMGLMKIKDKQLVKNENTAFVEARRFFIRSNNLSANNIISIKKDAIFTSQRCRNLKFGNIEFVPKNKYSTYIEINNLEFYYNKDKLDVKGISDILLKKHEGYMVEFFKDFFSLYESGSTKLLIDYMTEFVYRYKTRLLETEYYREFNATSSFMLNNVIEKKGFIIDEIDSSSLSDINIAYNYFNYLVPMTTMLI